MSGRVKSIRGGRTLFSTVGMIGAFIIGLVALLFGSNLLGQQDPNWIAKNNNDRPMNTIESVRLAINDMISRFDDQYPKGAEYLDELSQLQKSQPATDSSNYQSWKANFDRFQRKALLENPLLDFDEIAVVISSRPPTPGDNFVTLEKASRNSWDNELAILSDLRSDDPKITSIYKPKNGRPIAEPELHWDGKRIMFSSISEENGCWGIFEINIDGTDLKPLSPSDQNDVDFFDSCYTSAGDIITCSNAGRQGLPCVNGSDPMANIYKIDALTKKVRQLTFEQDSDWHPTPLANGRIMYLRWEYSDIMHYYSRILFQMNPDGTNQAELYGSGSMFPTAFKHAREFPDSSRIVGIASGHHGRGDTGRLIIIDPTVGRRYPFRYRPDSLEWGPEETQFDAHPDVLPFEQTGMVQEIPGYGLDVVGNVLDMQSTGLKYNFVFPYPLDENYLLVNCQIEGEDNTYGLYLVDLFDNMTLIKKIPKKGLFAPLPIVERDAPPIIPDRVIEGEKEATVFITDIYNGVGTANVPSGTIKGLKVFAYHFCYLNTGGHESVGVQSSWDIKRVLGTVDVEEDGSAFFKVPANTPLSIQPFDEQGAAVQLFRSWFVGMPGENVSCNGCHESQLDATPIVMTTASRREPSSLNEFYGPKRPVTFELDIYHRVVKKYCIGCHDGTKEDRPSFATAQKAYDNIHPFVRRPGPETDMDVLQPYEYHVSTSELWQLLEKGHRNTQLDEESWQLLANWIDFNAPWRGKWGNNSESNRRLELARLYAGTNDDIESEYDVLLAEMQSRPNPEFVKPPKWEAPKDELGDSWAFDAEVARQLQAEGAKNGEIRKTIPLGAGIEMEFVRIPVGEFVMGSLDGFDDEHPRKIVKIERPFWMSVTEVTNEQYNAFDPKHDTRYIEEHGKDHIVPGYIANHPNQPVARVSWNETMNFVEWLSDLTGFNANIPTESQWEWAARAGTADKFHFGSLDADYTPFANLADSDRRILYTQWENGAMIHRRRPYPQESVFPLRDDRFKDNWFVVDYVAQTLPNAWGLQDMIGNVSEWTRSDYQPYPWDDNDGRNDLSPTMRKVARGGSWHDRPKVTGSSTRYPYLPWQKVHNVGIRVILE